jgi:U3 small nucleolar RNA-associated protein 13
MSSVDEMDTSPPASSITGHPAVDEVIRTLAGSDLARLLRYVRDWNANAKTSAIAQNVLYAVVKLRPADDVAEAFGEEADGFSVRAGGGFGEGPNKGSRVGGTALRELVDALIPYTERHLSRMEKLVQDSYVVDYILSEMDDGIFDGAPEEEGSLGSGPM